MSSFRLGERDRLAMETSRVDSGVLGERISGSSSRRRREVEGREVVLLGIFLRSLRNSLGWAETRVGEKGQGEHRLQKREKT